MDSSKLRDELQKLKDSGQLRANPIIIATVHATRRDSKTGLITIQTSGSFWCSREVPIEGGFVVLEIGGTHGGLERMPVSAVEFRKLQYILHSPYET